MKTLFSRLHVRFLVRTLAAALLLLPVLWMVAAALRPPGGPLPQRLHQLLARPTMANFGQVWQLVPIGRFALNSIFVVALAVPLTLVTGSWAGFSMAQLPRASQRRLVLVSLAVLMVPSIALWSPRFLIYKQLGWLDTVWALIAPAWMGTSPFFVLMFYRAFRRIPAATYDAARLDGAGVLRTWASIALPMARPTVIGVALLSGVLYWGDFLGPLLYLRSESHYTLPIALQLLEQLDRSDWPLLMAAAVIATGIPVTVFVLAQRFIARVE